MMRFFFTLLLCSALLGSAVSYSVIPPTKQWTTSNKALFGSAQSFPSLDRDAWKTELEHAELQGLVETAEAAARAAGQVIVSHLGCAAEVCDPTTDEECEIKTNLKDIVTQYDKQAQESVESIIRDAYPLHSFLGEEDVNPGAAASEAALEAALAKSESGFVWICDPIDGTANFAAGLTLCAVTVSVVYKGTTVIGVIYDPHQDELFSAVKGEGQSSLNGKPMPNLKEYHAIESIRDAIINAGCPADPNAFATSMRGVMALNGRSRGLRMIACSALTTAWIAAGRLNAHFGYDLSSWDLAPGALLISESGGIVTDLDGSPYQLETRNMLCSTNLVVHQDVLQILTEADAVSFTRSQ
mmetsp:Transcript_16317/g.21361  ORF Transcript_16317/g.21361 Transcript_16317/m.21361 type:complete len:356 (-) Transcript_16317:54-1121(-)